jgi:hypothetical protein
MYDFTEEILVGVIRALSYCGTPPTPTTIIQFVKKEVLKQDSWDGWHWWKNFYERHKKDLRKRYCNPTTSSRKQPVIVDHVKQWIQEFKEELDTFSFKEDFIFNADETLLVPKKGGKLDAVRLVASDQDGPHNVQIREETAGSFIPFVSASGTVLFSVYILKVKFGEKLKKTTSIEVVPKRYHTRGTWKRYYGFTETGRINSGMWKKILEVFQQELSIHYPGKTVLLTLDNLEAHITESNVFWSLQNNIRVFPYPANASLFIQCLDQTPFGLFKSELKKKYNSIHSASILTGKGTKNSILKASLDIEDTVFTKEVIKEGWRVTGVWPFDPKVILGRAKKNVGQKKKDDKN